MIIDIKEKLLNTDINERGYKELVRECIRKNNINETNKIDGNNLLIYAVKYIKKDLVLLLLENNINPNCQNKMGDTALITCLKTMKINPSKSLELLEILQILKDYNANPNLQNYSLANAYFYAAGLYTKQIYSILLPEREKTLKKIK